MQQLLNNIKVEAFVDHGPNLENAEFASEDYSAYLHALGDTKRIIVKPGDRLPIQGLDVNVPAGGGAYIVGALPGAGAPNPFCATEPKPDKDDSENAASLGLLVRFGDFLFVDLGDLTKDKELPLCCPDNLIGAVDLFLVSHHGMNYSNTKALIDALHPRVTIMENGPHKGDDSKVWQILHDSLGLQGFSSSTTRLIPAPSITCRKKQ